MDDSPEPAPAPSPAELPIDAAARRAALWRAGGPLTAALLAVGVSAYAAAAAMTAPGRTAASLAAGASVVLPACSAGLAVLLGGVGSALGAVEVGPDGLARRWGGLRVRLRWSMVSDIRPGGGVVVLLAGRRLLELPLAEDAADACTTALHRLWRTAVTGSGRRLLAPAPPARWTPLLALALAAGLWGAAALAAGAALLENAATWGLAAGTALGGLWCAAGGLDVVNDTCLLTPHGLSGRATGGKEPLLWNQVRLAVHSLPARPEADALGRLGLAWPRVACWLTLPYRQAAWVLAWLLRDAAQATFVNLQAWPARAQAGQVVQPESLPAVESRRQNRRTLRRLRRTRWTRTAPSWALAAASLLAMWVAAEGGIAHAIWGLGAFGAWLSRGVQHWRQMGRLCDAARRALLDSRPAKPSAWA